jgi:hypothetical protein
MEEKVAARKTVTRQTLIGERGVTLIEQRCLEMGLRNDPSVNAETSAPDV